MDTKIETLNCEYLNEEYFKITHSSGLKIFIYPKKDFKSTYAIFGTNFGSINTKFKDPKISQTTSIPRGTAHFLEHKLFESETNDAFSRYAKTGASANAYTSFNSTCYLFSCTENFEKSLEILLDFVKSPYFTEETIKKEQGIIGQEIKMYEDNPDWKVMFNLLNALYHEHPVKFDIAGSVESIAQITKDKLYDCYNSFYNLNNMALCIAGNVNVNSVLKIVDNIIKPEKNIIAETIFPVEPDNIVKKRVQQELEVNIPLFEIGFKEKAKLLRPTVKELVLTDILLQSFCSKASSLYKELLENNLINASSFSYEYMEGPFYRNIIIAGESYNPDKVYEIVTNAAENLHKNKIDNESFKIAQKAVYGKTVAALNNASSIANILADFAFSNKELFSYIDTIKNVNVNDLNNRLSSQLLTEFSAISIINPVKK